MTYHYPSVPTSCDNVICEKCGNIHLRGTMCPLCMGALPPAFTFPTVAPSGWTCPKCGSIWGPHVVGCEKCNGDKP